MAAFSYTYRVPGLYKTPAEIAGSVCQQLQNSADGLTPRTLLDASRDVNAPLHKEFEWRDDVAAEKYRLRQAQGIIQNIVVVEITKADEVPKADRAFVCTPGGKSAYVSLQSALTNDKWREYLLGEAKREMQSFEQKYRRIKELAGVMEAIDEALDNEAM